MACGSDMWRCLQSSLIQKGGALILLFLAWKLRTTSACMVAECFEFAYGLLGRVYNILNLGGETRVLEDDRRGKIERKEGL